MKNRCGTEVEPRIEKFAVQTINHVRAGPYHLHLRGLGRKCRRQYWRRKQRPRQDKWIKTVLEMWGLTKGIQKGGWCIYHSCVLEK